MSGPLAKLRAYKLRMGWTFPWASSLGSDFNSDFNASFTEEQQRKGGIEYNYEQEKPVGNSHAEKTTKNRRSRDSQYPEAEFAAMTGIDALAYPQERPEMSSLETVSCITPIQHMHEVLDILWGMYQWLDRAPHGRNETGLWFRRHDEYDKS